MIRENLTSYPSSQQLAFDSFESCSALTSKSQMAFGIMPRQMKRREYTITNKDLVTQFRWCEFLRMMEQMTLEFSEPDEIGKLFRNMGVDTRSGNIWEMYLEQDSLFCDYRFQVNLNQDAPFFIKILAYAKDCGKQRHHH